MSLTIWILSIILLRMKTLLINCYTKNWEEKVKNYLSILQIFGEVEVIRDEEIRDDFDPNPYNALIISGSGKDITKREYTESFLSLLRNRDRPLLGICYGHQVLAHAYGCEVVMGDQMTNRFDENPHSVEIKEEDSLFFGFGSVIKVDEDHHEYVEIEGNENCPFILLATSLTCPVEAIQHREKPISGVQFHPERSGEMGKGIFENFYERIVKKKNY